MSRPCVSKPLPEHAVKRSKSTLCRVGHSLGLAAALVAATVLAPRAGAQPMEASAERGDLALVPYYTVRDQWLTGIHIVNTSDSTQVVKVRLRRATDGMNALDFNVVMSPQDVYAGFLSDDQNGNISWASPDSSCTAPATQANRLTMPPIYRVGAESGYVEIIAMGQAADDQPIAVAAKHSATTSMPLDCAAVRSNFFADGVAAVAADPANNQAAVAGKRGVLNNRQTYQPGVASASDTTIKTGGTNTYTDSGNVLKVSYFIRDNSTGIEFGDNAVHIADFLGLPSITNQEYGIGSGDLNGFDFPDLDGTGLPNGAASSTIERGRFNRLRRQDVLGVDSMINEWSANPANGVEMDWVVTLPGQYTMLRLPQYLASLGADRAWVSTIDSAGRPGFNPQCPRQAMAANPATAAAAVPACDFRDLPLKLTYTAYNREESAGPPPPPATLQVGSQPPTARAATYLPKVANVIGFGGNSVLGQPDVDVTANLRQPFGWVEAQLESQSDPKVCQWDPSQDATSPSAAAANLTLDCATSATGNAPVIGFAAWSRRLAANSEASYGRIVEHSDTPRALGSNIPPRVDAGEDQLVTVGQQVRLDSTASDTDGRIVSIQWRQISGPEVTLSDADTAQASFTPPAPTGGVRFDDREFEVTARDDQGAVGRDTVRVRAMLVLNNSRTRNNKIEVFIVPDKSVDEDSDVQLWAAAIATGKAVVASQTWTQTSGQPTVSLVNASQPLADFKAPKLPQDTAKRDLTFKFEVTGNPGGTVNKSVTITVRDINNRAPSMTSPARADLKIGDWRVFELTADDGDTTGEPIRFKLGGKDKALFTVDIDNDKSILHFKTPPQAGAPVCSETTPCVITITPSDGINKGNPQTVTITVAPPPPPKRLLNDTGVNFSGYSAHTYNLQLIEKPDINANTCLSATSALGAPQDCNQGRDSVAIKSKIGAGKAGFDFTKLGRNGQVLAIQNASYAANGGQESLGTQWSCVRDNHTGFVWEVKTRDGSVHDRARLFSARSVNQLLQAANSGSGLCGFKDWRVPNIDELSNIVLRAKIPGNNLLAMDTDFFPNTQSGSRGYLSATPASRTRVPYCNPPINNRSQK